ncbi:Ats1 protein [Martiniozyma asiatica (nom. inval.)]|nr:Ats1 protein [Martiniozyma asiatica]
MKLKKLPSNSLMDSVLLCCGSNGSGQLGLGHKNDLNHLEKVQFNLTGFEPVKVVCGGNHTLVLGKDGSVFGSGLAMGRLAALEIENLKKFERIEGIYKDIAAGWEFSILVNCKNEIFAFGEGFNGELGLGKGTHKAKASKCKLNFKAKDDIKMIKASIHSVILQLSNGEIYAWGNNKRGQLLNFGMDKSLKVLWEPTLLPFEDTVLDWAMGREFTVFLTKSKQGNLRLKFKGKDTFNIEHSMSQLKDLSNVKLLAMWTSLHCEINSTLFSFGNSSHGQLYAFDHNQKSLFTVGSEHGLCYDNVNHSVLSWGWGEHGNCGLPPDATEITNVTFDFLNTLYKVPKQKEVVGLFGGCASSWVLVKDPTTSSCC